MSTVGSDSAEPASPVTDIVGSFSDLEILEKDFLDRQDELSNLTDDSLISQLDDADQSVSVESQFDSVEDGLLDIQSIQQELDAT